jgi:hypothetical protein
MLVGRPFQIAGKTRLSSPGNLEIMNYYSSRLDSSILRDLPARGGPKPKTIRGPLHIQCDEHGDFRYISQLVKDVLSWPHIETRSTSDRTATIPIRFKRGTATLNSARLIGEREFARVMLGAPTIYVALPLIYAHRAITRGWAELHYSAALGVMPVGTVVLYTPRSAQELSICYAFFSTAYHSAVSVKHLKMNVPPGELATSGPSLTHSRKMGTGHASIGKVAYPEKLCPCPLIRGCRIDDRHIK